MYSHGARDAHNPCMNLMPYQRCDVTTPIHVRNHMTGLRENDDRNVAAAYSPVTPTYAHWSAVVAGCAGNANTPPPSSTPKTNSEGTK